MPSQPRWNLNLEHSHIRNIDKHFALRANVTAILHPSATKILKAAYEMQNQVSEFHTYLLIFTPSHKYRCTVVVTYQQFLHTLLNAYPWVILPSVTYTPVNNCYFLDEKGNIDSCEAASIHLNGKQLIRAKYSVSKYRMHNKICSTVVMFHFIISAIF